MSTLSQFLRMGCTVSTTAPASPSIGNLWWNSEEGNLYVYYTDGSSNQWVAASIAPPVDGLAISDTAPSAPESGDLWWNSEEGNLYIYYNDGTSSQWVPATPAPAAPVTGRNKIIGGDFTTNPWQRGTTFAAATAGYKADRFKLDYGSTTAVVTVQKTADAPTVTEAGVYTQHCLHVDVTTADTSIGTSEYLLLYQAVEGLNSAVFGFGQSGTRYVTLSFWVKATKTGTYCCSFRNSAATRSYVKEYTVNVTNTWEKKTLTIPVDTTGTWLYDTGIGLTVFWVLACGSSAHTTADAWAAGNYLATSNQVNALDSTANDFKIALVQLEPGSVATDFEALDITTVTARCQRYYEKYGGTNAEGIFAGDVGSGGGVFYYSIGWFLVEKRAAPTMTYTYIGNSGAFNTDNPTANVSTIRGWRCYKASTGTGFGAYYVYSWTAEIEL